MVSKYRRALNWSEWVICFEGFLVAIFLLYISFVPYLHIFFLSLWFTEDGAETDARVCCGGQCRYICCEQITLGEMVFALKENICSLS